MMALPLSDPGGTVLASAERAARVIPPLWPLASSVAVNPFLGLGDRTLSEAAALLGRAGGIPVTMPRRFYRQRWETGEITRADVEAGLTQLGAALSAEEVIGALTAEPPGPAAIPTIAELCAELSGTDWPGLVQDRIASWAGGHFDLGQAMWPKAEASGAYSSWRIFATHDFTPEIAGIRGFCRRVARQPQEAREAIVSAGAALGLPEDACESYFLSLLLRLGGWAQYARKLQWEAERDGGADDAPLELLAVALSFEAALHAQFRRQIDEAWQAAVARHATPCEPSRDQTIDAVLQEACEHAHQRRLIATLAASSGPVQEPFGRPAIQAAFCIDVRSEVIRRSLETLDPGVETLGFAGFFGIGAAHRRLGSLTHETRLPVLLRPGVNSFTCDDPHAGGDETARIQSRLRRAWGRFKRAAVSSFAFVEASGPLYAWKLLRDSVAAEEPPLADGGRPRFAQDMPLAARAEMAATILKAMSLTSRFAPLILLAGHGAKVANNAHASALQCGACGGFPGDVNARLLAGLLNDAELRRELVGLGITIPADTLFVAGLHDTVSDEVTLFDAQAIPESHRGSVRRLRDLLDQAGALARTERAALLPGTPSAQAVARRGANWAEVRPEWGLARCKTFIAAPRTLTRSARLDGRAFLHSYDRQSDPDRKVLELILTAPVVVASWISLQYYGSTVAPAQFGAGNKLLHNVVGGMGVFEGNGGVLRGGLPWQSVHDGRDYVHEPLRLSVIVAASREAITAVLQRHPTVRALFDHGWLSLFAMSDCGSVDWCYDRRGGWTAVAGEADAVQWAA